MNKETYLEYKSKVEKYEEITSYIEEKKVDVKLLKACISSEYDKAMVYMTGNVVENKPQIIFSLRDEEMEYLIERREKDIKELQKILENLK